MEIKNKTELSSKDLLKYSLKNLKMIETEIVIGFLSLLLMISGLSSIIIAKGNNKPIKDQLFILIFGIILLFVLLFLIFIVPKLIKRHFKKFYGYDGAKFEYVFKDKIVITSIIKNNKYSLNLEYDNVKKIVENAYTLLIYTFGKSYYIVNVDGFNNKEEKDILLNMLRENVKNYKKKNLIDE